MQVTHSTTTSLRSVRLSQSDKSSSVYSPRTPAILLASSIERKPLILGPTQSWSESAIIIAGSSVLLHRSEVVAAEHLAKHVLSDAARKACLRAFPALRNLEVMTNQCWQDVSRRKDLPIPHLPKRSKPIVKLFPARCVTRFVLVGL